MMNQEQDSNPTPEMPFWWQEIKWVLVFSLLAFFGWLLFWRKRAEKIEKRDLIRPYGVDKKTFSKWVQIFCSDLIEPAKYKACRKLPVEIADAIQERLGTCTDEMPVLTKGIIIEKSDSSYRTLRENIQKFPEKFGLTPEAFASLDIFPPKISAHILESFG